ncbi:anhydro-N-acetylmuramic acid kinase AnmK [Pseudofrancisella aestuarii]|uniref:Anhydro-N-acetylmuramic acid kinase n=1 Tax=Pseudofrancisella aestuarii TaxID=2670347 RepID=A0ABV9TBG6_9GAMM|nr:anhydro-N-acetylmuramic acid kinase AnmK [Pseudofrancisella aestuarii]
MNDYKYCIGLMSGTSLDGIDVALCKIRGFSTDTDIKLIDFKTYKYSENVLEDIKDALDISKSNSKLLCSLNFKLGKEYARAVKLMCKEASISLEDVNFIANHGQTIYHQNKDEGNFVKSSLQLGDAATIAYECKTTVVSNFRCGDIAAGGDGAPLVPYVDYLLYRDENKTRALHNIGGIANTTVIPKGGSVNDIIAFDTGPGNMMINRAVEVLFGKPFDEDGNIAAKGKIISAMLEELLGNPYFKRLPPKSTGRELFGIDYTDSILEKYKNNDRYDIVHTLTIFTAETILEAYKNFVESKYKLDEIIFTGGGAYNKFLINYMRNKLLAKVKIFEDIGENSDAKEAVAFAVLGNETLHKIYNNIPSATGAKEKVILGQINF